MTEITIVGLDLAKNVFQVHCADDDGVCVLRKRLRRRQVLEFFSGLDPCVVAMEACGSAHHWARELKALGHQVKLIAPQFVKPYVKTNKTDAADAEAICEAAQRPGMRFAPVKSEEQQSLLMLHRARELLVRQRTMLINALRGHCAEFGVIAPQGAPKVKELIVLIKEGRDHRLPDVARSALRVLVDQLAQTETQIKALAKRIDAWHRTSTASQNLATIPGVGILTATALVATIGDACQFKSGRELAAWLGLVPRQHSSGGKQRSGRISKRGDGYLRRLLVHGARTVLRWSKHKGDRDPWIERLLIRRPTTVVLVAMANKTARIAWALLTRNEAYRSPAAA